MIGASTECERGNHRRQFGPDAMCCDQELRLNGERAKGVSEAAATAIPRRPAIARGFAIMGHGSSFPRDQRVQCLGWNDRPATDADSPKATSRNVIVEGSPAQA